MLLPRENFVNVTDQWPYCPLVGPPSFRTGSVCQERDAERLTFALFPSRRLFPHVPRRFELNWKVKLPKLSSGTGDVKTLTPGKARPKIELVPLFVDVASPACSVSKE